MKRRSQYHIKTTLTISEKKKREQYLKRRKEKRDEKLYNTLNKVENPIRNSVVIAIVFLCIGIAFGPIFTAINTYAYIVNYMTSFAIIFAFSLLWVFVRLGWAEKTRLKFRNYRNRLLQKTVKTDIKAKQMDLAEYRAFIKKHSWVGVILLSSCSLVALLICILIYYV